MVNKGILTLFKMDYNNMEEELPKYSEHLQNILTLGANRMATAESKTSSRQQNMEANLSTILDHVADLEIKSDCTSSLTKNPCLTYNKTVDIQATKPIQVCELPEGKMEQLIASGSINTNSCSCVPEYLQDQSKAMDQYSCVSAASSQQEGEVSCKKAIPIAKTPRHLRTETCFPLVIEDNDDTVRGSPLHFGFSTRSPTLSHHNDPTTAEYTGGLGYGQQLSPVSATEAESKLFFNTVKQQPEKTVDDSAAVGSIRVMLEKVEQLVKEKAELQNLNLCLQMKIGNMNEYIGRLHSERGDYFRRCESLEDQLRSIELKSSEFSTKLQQATQEKLSLEMQNKHAIQMAEYWEFQYKIVEQIRTSLHQQTMALKEATESSQSLDQVEVVDSDNSIGESADTETLTTSQSAIVGSPTRTFIVEKPLEIKECRLCYHTFNINDDDDDCMFHPTRPLIYEEWRKMLPHEAMKLSKRNHRLYYCCWKLASRRPPGCLGPRKHVQLDN